MMLLLLLAPVLLYIAYQFLKPQKGTPFPSLRVWALAGIKQSFARAVQPLCEKLGPIFQVYIRYFIPLVVLSDAELCKAVLQKRKNFNLPPHVFRAFRSLLPHSLLSLDGADWKRHHEAMSGLFHLNHLEKLVPEIEHVAMQFVNKWKSQIEQSKDKSIEFNIKQDLTNMSADMVSSAVLGFNMQDVVSEQQCVKIRSAVDLILTTIHARIRSIIPFYRLFKNPDNVEEAVKTLRSFVYQVIEKEMQKQQTEKNMVQSLIDKMQSGSITKDEIADEIMMLILAGFETTASATCNIVQAMAEFPTVAQALRKESSDAFKSITSLTSSDLDQHFSYSYQFCKEVLRYYPVAGAFVRVATEETIIGDNYCIPARSIVFVNAFAMHRNPKYYSDPTTFEPKRWTAEFEKNRHPFCFIPFGGGDRQCMGRLLAMLELRIAAALFANNFSFEITKPITEVSRITTSPVELWVRVKKLE